MNWLEAFSPSCREAVRLASEALDRPLSRRERVALRIHLALCGLCRRHVRQGILLHDGLRRHGALLAEGRAETLDAEEKRRIKASCRAAGE